MKIGAISLGCDKNRVDTEKMLARLVEAGHTLVGSEEEADVIIVNTCAFIDKAKEESIDEILGAIGAKNLSGGKKKIIVTGCLPSRYSEELKSEFGEVDALLGIADYDKIVETVERITKDERVFANACQDRFFEDRVLTTPYHYAYLKIADGCDNHCTYCAIPKIRGKYRSERIENLLAEAKKLSDDGVKELILVAQDVSRYGVDFDGKPHLFELVKELEKLDFDWIRLLYIYPEMVTDEFIEFIKNEPKVVKYLDVPLQHIDGALLKLMNRKITEEDARRIVGKIKDAGITLRTTFICGFPGETKEQFEKLKSFVQDTKFDYAGFFAYSREEGTPADKLPGHLADSVKQKRVNELAKLQSKIIEERNQRLVGNTVRVLYDDIDYDAQAFVGRTSRQAPDIDNVVYFSAEDEVHIGEYYDVKITGTRGVDLVGEVEK